MHIEPNDLELIREHHKDQKVVFRKGCFDLVHPGHVSALEFGKAQGDILVTGIVPDSRVRERKGEGRPVQSELARLAVIDAFESVDYAFIMPERNGPESPSPTQFALSALRPDVFVVNPRTEETWSEYVEEAGLPTRVVPNVGSKIHSTTNMIERIQGLVTVSN